MTTFQAIILAIVEGITEFLPISSTGHMVIAASLLGVPSDEFTKAYLVIIQFGAILSVVALYWRRFVQSLDFYKILLIAFIPAAVIGFVIHKIVDELLESVITVGIALLLGGFFLAFMDRWIKPGIKSNPGRSEAAKIGLFQCLAMVPGVSRSAATIVGGLIQGLSRAKAAEFSFLLAVPTMFAATVFKARKLAGIIEGDQIEILLLGNVVAFVVAGLSIKFLMSYISKNSFKIFGYYRIAVGAAVLVLSFAGFELRLI